MPFTNLFRKCPPSRPSPSSSSYRTTTRSDLHAVHLSLGFRLSQANALQQMDVLVGDEDELSGWEVPEECAWLEVIPTHGSRLSTARSAAGRPKTPRRPMGAVKGSRFIETFDIDLGEGKEKNGDKLNGDEADEHLERPGCLFDAVEEEKLAVNLPARPPMSSGQRFSSYFGKLTVVRSKKE